MIRYFTSSKRKKCPQWFPDIIRKCWEQIHLCVITGNPPVTCLSLLFFFFNLFLFIYFWLCWVFVSVRGLSLVAASGGPSSSWCAGLWLSQPLLLRSTGSRSSGSVIVAHGPSCSAACGIFPDQGSNPCPLHWQADSQPLRHQGSPTSDIKEQTVKCWHLKCKVLQYILYLVKNTSQRH